MVFVLLGRDPAAPAAIRAWAEERVRLGKNAPGDAQITEALECADTMETEARMWVGAPTHYPPGMGAEFRRLHREYSRLVEAQARGENNYREVVALTDEAARKGIVLVPGGEDL